MSRAEMTISPYGRATCAVCGREMSLLKNSMIRAHPVKRPPGGRYGAPQCEGSGKPPATTATTKTGDTR